MTNDQIALWADAADAPFVQISMGRGAAAMFSAAQLRHFAALVAAAEREACALECEILEQRKWESAFGSGGRIAFAGPAHCAKAIRTRTAYV